MKTRSNTDIRQIISDVKQEYPFPDIIEETADTIQVLAEALDKLAPNGGRLLDIGCGALDKTIVFQEMGYECFGCDDFQDPWHSLQENLDPVLACAKRAGVQVHAQDEHFTIPWDQESFDLVTLINVIEHVHDSPRGILNFAGGCLKTGGLLLVGMPNSVNLRKRLSVLQGKSNYTPARGFYENDGSWRGHVREFTFQETIDLLEWNGFQTVYKKTFHGMLKRRLGNPLLRGLFKAVALPAPGFRDSLLVVARKPENWVERVPDRDSMQQSLTDSWLER
jgi:SAM-dependent methyltransferase